MNSIMEYLISKRYPDYDHDQIWQEIWEYCEKNEKKIDLFLRLYQFIPQTKEFEEKQEQLINLVQNASDRELQTLFRFLSNFELAILFLLADKETEKRLHENVTKRIDRIIAAEAYTIAKQIRPNEKQFEVMIAKILKVFFSEEMVQWRKKEWEA